MIEDLGTVFSGGGFKCSFGAGQMMALYDMKAIPKVMVGASGNAPTAAYKIAGQIDAIETLWTRFVPQSKISKEKSIRINIENLIKVFENTIPLDKEKFIMAETGLYVSVLDANSGETEYLNVKTNDILNSLHATMALPFAYKMNPQVKVGSKYYLDSMEAGAAKAHVPMAMALGADKVIMINNSPKRIGGQINYAAFKAWSRFKGEDFYDNYIDRLEEIEETSLDGVKVLELAPDMSYFPLTTINNNAGLMLWGIENGYSQTMARRSEIEDFVA